jgi:hypothetical protein
MGSLAMRKAVLIRRFSRKLSSSARRSSIASMPSISPCSMRRSVASSISRARGIFKPTRLWRILSTREDALASVMAGLRWRAARQSPGK